MSVATQGQLDPGVLQLLLQPLDGAGALLGQHGPHPGEVPQPTDRLGGHEGGPQQSALGQLAQPRGIGDVGLAAGHGLGVAGVDQNHVQLPLQEVEHRPPVVPGGLHRHQGHPLSTQPVQQRQQCVGGGGEGADLAVAASPALPHRRPYTCLDVAFADVERRAPLVHDLHGDRPPSFDGRAIYCCPEEPEGRRL